VVIDYEDALETITGWHYHLSYWSLEVQLWLQGPSGIAEKAGQR
jgi:hypothetical protein